MTLCFYFPSLKNDQNNAVFSSMYVGFFQALEKCGYRVHFTTELEDIKGDILVTSIGNGLERAAAKAMTRFNGPVILSVYNSYICFYESFLKRWRKKILFVYNPDYATLNFTKYKAVGISYHHFPFGSDQNTFFPINSIKKYDICFLGNGHSGYGRDKYIDAILKYVKTNNLNIFLAGAGWDKYGYPMQIVKHGKQTNEIYNQSKICINIHNDRQYAGIELEMDANNRLFDLAMAGCCQVSNGEKMIERYFSKEEVASADKPELWIDTIHHLLNNEEKRIALGQNAREKALKEHSWDNRAAQFVSHINNSLSLYNEKDQRVNKVTAILRNIDQYLIPPYLFKEIRIIRIILIQLGLYNRK